MKKRWFSPWEEKWYCSKHLHTRSPSGGSVFTPTWSRLNWNVGLKEAVRPYGGRASLRNQLHSCVSPSVIIKLSKLINCVRTQNYTQEKLVSSCWETQQLNVLSPVLLLSGFSSVLCLNKLKSNSCEMLFWVLTLQSVTASCSLFWPRLHFHFM